MCCDPAVPPGNVVGAATGREDPDAPYGCAHCGRFLWGFQVAEHMAHCDPYSPETLTPGYPFLFSDPFD